MGSWVYTRNFFRAGGVHQEFFSCGGVHQEFFSFGGCTPGIFFVRGVYIRNFFRSGGVHQEFFFGEVQQIQLKIEGRDNGDLGVVAP
jgi:hypothetical protein